MNSYPIAIPSSNSYLIPDSSLNHNVVRKKIIKHNEIKKTLNYSGHDIVVVDIQTVISDVDNTNFNKFLQKAVKYLEEHAPQTIITQAKPYLISLNEKTNLFSNLNLPLFSVSLPEDGEVLLEWRFEHFTIGISFEENPEDSSYYMVNDGTVKKTTAWGYLRSQSVEDLVRDIMNEVIWNG